MLLNFGTRKQRKETRQVSNSQCLTREEVAKALTEQFRASPLLQGLRVTLPAL